MSSPPFEGLIQSIATRIVGKSKSNREDLCQVARIKIDELNRRTDLPEDPIKRRKYFVRCIYTSMIRYSIEDQLIYVPAEIIRAKKAKKHRILAFNDNNSSKIHADTVDFWDTVNVACEGDQSKIDIIKMYVSGFSYKEICAALDLYFYQAQECVEMVAKWFKPR